jgi:hypothetical protein
MEARAAPSASPGEPGERSMAPEEPFGQLKTPEEKLVILEESV